MTQAPSTFCGERAGGPVVGVVGVGDRKRRLAAASSNNQPGAASPHDPPFIANRPRRYGLALPLPFGAHAAVQSALWLAVSLKLGRAVCNRHLRPCEAPAFGRLRDAAAVLVDALSHGAGAAAVGGGGRPWRGGGGPPVGGLASGASSLFPCEGRCPAADAAGMGGMGGCGAPSAFNFDSSSTAAAAASEQGRLACHVIVQLTLLTCGLAVPLLCGCALERTLRRRYAARLRAGGTGSSGSSGSSRRSPGALYSEEWDCCAAAPGRLALESGEVSPVAVTFVALSVFLFAWVLVHAVARHL
jgi:hypothetical protein